MDQKEFEKCLDAAVSTFEISKFEVALRALTIEKVLKQKNNAGQYIHIDVQKSGEIRIDCQANGSVIIQSLHSLLKSTDARKILTGIAALELCDQLGAIDTKGISKRFDSREEMDVFKTLFNASDEERERIKKELENE